MGVFDSMMEKSISSRSTLVITMGSWDYSQESNTQAIASAMFWRRGLLVAQTQNKAG